MKLPRFTLRDIFWLVLVATMGCAWGLEWLKRANLENDNDGLWKSIVRLQEQDEAWQRATGVTSPDRVRR